MSRQRLPALGVVIVCAAMFLAPATSHGTSASPLRDVKVQNWTEDPSLDWIAGAVRFYGLWYSDIFTLATGKTVVEEGALDDGYTLYGGYYLVGDDISLGVTLWKGKTFLDDRHFSGSPENAAEWLSGIGEFLAGYLFPGEENLKITAHPTSSTAALKSFLLAGEAEDEAAAEALLEEALGEDAAFLEASWKIGVMQLVRKEYQKALSHFAAYGAARPLHAGAHYNRALSLLGLERNAEALGIVENVALDRGKETATVLMLVTVYKASGLDQEAAAMRAGLPEKVAGSRPMVFTSPYPGVLPASWMAEGPRADGSREASPLIKVAEAGLEKSAVQVPPAPAVEEAPAAVGKKAESSSSREDKALADKAALRRELEEYRKLTAELQESLQEIQQEAAKVAWEAMEAGDVEEESRQEIASLKVEKEDLAGRVAAGEERVNALQEKLRARDAGMAELTRTVEALRAKEAEKQAELKHDTEALQAKETEGLAAGEKAGRLEEELRQLTAVLEEVERREQENAARIVTLLDELKQERIRVKDLDGMLTEERERTGDSKVSDDREVLRLQGEVEKLESKIAALQAEGKKEPAKQEDRGKVEEELRKVEQVLEEVEGREQENAERIVALLDEFERERARAKDLEKGLTAEQGKAGDLEKAIEKEKKRSEDLVAEVLKERSRAKEFEASLRKLRERGPAAAPPAAEQEELESEYEKRFSSLEKELGRKEKEVASAAARIIELEADREELKDKLEAAVAEVENTPPALPAASAEWDDAQKTEYWEERTRDLQQTIAELSRRESEMVAEVQIRDEMIEELRRNADGGEVSVDTAELRSEAAQLEARAAGMEAELQAERKRVEELTLSLASRNIEEGNAAEDLKKKDALIAGYKKEIAELEAKEPGDVDLDKKAKKRIAKLEAKLVEEEEKRKADVGRLEAKLAESGVEAGALGQRTGDLEKELKKARDDGEKAAGEREKLEEKHRAEIEDLAKRHEAAFEELVKKKAVTTEELRSKYTAVVEELEKKHAGEIERLLKELSSERQKAEKELAEWAREAAGAVAALEESLAEERAGREEAIEQVGRLEGSLNEETAKREEARGEYGKSVDELKGKISALEKDLSRSGKDKGKAAKQIEDLEGERNKLQEKLDKRNEDLSTYYNRVDDLADSVSKLEKELFESRKERVNALERVRELEREKEELEGGLKERERTVKASQKDLEALEKEMSKLRKGEEKRVSELAKLEKKRKGLEENLKTSSRELEGKLDAQKRQLEEERKRAASLEKNAGKESEKAAELRESLETMQKSLDLSLERTADLEAEMEELRALNKKLADKVKEKTLELLELQVR